jgi:hypothetical protein
MRRHPFNFLLVTWEKRNPKLGNLPLSTNEFVAAFVFPVRKEQDPKGSDGTDACPYSNKAVEKDYDCRQRDWVLCNKKHHNEVCDAQSERHKSPETNSI